MEKFKYEKPDIEVIMFSSEDVITTSIGDSDDYKDPFETPEL